MLNKLDETLPIATQCIIANSLPSDEACITNVFLIYCPMIQSKGTGFLLSNGVIISNEHVVRDATDNEIIAISSSGRRYRIKKSIRDQKRDLVILIVEETLQGGLELDNSKIQTRQVVHTWGFPLMHVGPAPLLSVGYVSGFQHTPKKGKRLVINGAFNPGNSGGPLFKMDSNQVCGIVVAKWAIPLTPFQQSALAALKTNVSGMQFTATNQEGLSQNFSESQLVADLLNQYWRHAQLMIGEAIPVEELLSFLQKHSLT